MSTANQNFIVGLISAIALVVGLVYTFISIHKTNLEIRKLQLENQKQKNTKISKAVSQPRNNERKGFLSVGFVFDVIFFIFFSIGSINAIVEFIANRVPVIALITAQFIVLLYSGILLGNAIGTISQRVTFSKQENRYFIVVGLFGFSIGTVFAILTSLARIGLLSSFTLTQEKVFSVIVNVSIAPLLVFSLVTLYRIIRYISDVSASQ